ncbi:MAG: GAF domain-containing protein [Candidatus Binatia bacterium]
MRAEDRFQRRIAAAIATGAELEMVLAIIVRAAACVLRSPMAAIALATNSSDELELVSAFGMNASVLRKRLPLAASLTGLAVSSGRSVRSSDILRDPRPVAREIPLMSGTRGVLIVPLRDGDGSFGTVAVAKRTPWSFTDGDRALLTQLADNASTAIRYAQLRARLQVSTPQVRGAKPLSAPSHTWRALSPSQVSGKTQPHLSPREREIIELLIGGKTCKEAAANLGLSKRTVDHYLERLKQRFGQQRLPALVAYVHKHVPSLSVCVSCWFVPLVSRLIPELPA